MSDWGWSPSSEMMPLIHRVYDPRSGRTDTWWLMHGPDGGLCYVLLRVFWEPRPYRPEGFKTVRDC